MIYGIVYKTVKLIKYLMNFNSTTQIRLTYTAAAATASTSASATPAATKAREEEGCHQIR
jgi:hypothetical protein